MNKINFSLLVCAALCLSSCGYEDFEKRCAREAREYTENQCPRRLDLCTVMDSLTYDTGTHTLSYYYTLEGELDNDSLQNAGAFDKLEDLLRKHLANSVDMKPYKDKNLSFFYCYHSKESGKVRYKVLFTPEDYGGTSQQENE